MAFRSVPLLGLCLCLLPAALARAGEPRAARRPSTPTLERRLADLEAQISRLVEEIRSLRAELPKRQTPAEPGRVIRVFRLNHANATTLAATLQGTVQGKALRIIPDARTNSLVVQGTPDLLDTLTALVQHLDEKPGSGNPGP